MSMVARFLYYKIAAGELGERMSGHGTSGSVHGPCAKLHTLAGAGLKVGRVTAPLEVDGGRNRDRTLGGGRCGRWKEPHPWRWTVGGKKQDVGVRCL